MAPDTKFRIGSITKQFTAAAILQLAEQGKLSLDDPISKYYRPRREAWAPITLKHCSPTPPAFPATPRSRASSGCPRAPTCSPEEDLALTRDKPLEFTPGAKFSYDNTGYILLGYVVEKVSGQTYRTYLQDHIFEPLGLNNTGFDLSRPLLPTRAAGYTAAPSGGSPTPVPGHALPYAAGSLYSTADDLLAWDLALQSGKVDQPGLGDRHVHRLRVRLRLRPVRRRAGWQAASGPRRRHQRLRLDPVRYPDQG
jgi:CubicO group peptidase (beta-lactamase class C family)